MQHRMRGGALRFGGGGYAYYGDGPGPFGLTRIDPNSGAPSQVTTRIPSAQPGGSQPGGAQGAANTAAGNAASSNIRIGGRMRAAPFNMDDYLNYGMRAAKKFYIADGGPVRRADEAISRANKALSRLSARTEQAAAKPKKPVRKADGGKVGLTTNAIRAIQEALSHLGSRDRQRAVESLRASREALAHPEVKKATEELRYNEGVTPGTKRLRSLVETKDTLGLPYGLAAGGPAAQAMMGGEEMPEAQNEDPKMLFVEMQQLVAAIQSGQLSHEEEEEAQDRVEEIEQLLSSMGVQLPGFDPSGGGEAPPEMAEEGGGSPQDMMSALGMMGQ